MPKGYAVPMDDFGSLGEQLLGRGDGKRTTKTFVEDGTLAMMIGMVRKYPEMLINIGRHLHARDHGLRVQDVTPEQILDEYPEARECIELIQTIIELKGSQGGFLVDRFTKQATPEEMNETEKKKESSGEVKGGKRWN